MAKDEALHWSMDHSVRVINFKMSMPGGLETTTPGEKGWTFWDEPRSSDYSHPVWKPTQRPWGIFVSFFPPAINGWTNQVALALVINPTCGNRGVGSTSSSLAIAVVVWSTCQSRKADPDLLMWHLEGPTNNSMRVDSTGLTPPQGSSDLSY